jgi:hypothetical protein
MSLPTHSPRGRLHPSFEHWSSSNPLSACEAKRISSTLREPFYWRAAKNTAATLTPRRSSMRTDVANSDIIPPSSDREVANG